MAVKNLTDDSLRVNVDQIPDEGLTIRAREPIDRFLALRDVFLDGGPVLDAPLEIEIRLRWAGKFVEASGRLETSVRLTCSRCLEDFSSLLSFPFEATYSEEGRIPETSDNETEIELTAESIDQFPIQGRKLDLVDAIQEQVLLSMPMRPLCREECKGLCPRCGKDLNKGACECTVKAIDPRLAALGRLKLKK